MNIRQKKALYESIMKNVAKQVKKALNERYSDFNSKILQREYQDEFVYCISRKSVMYAEDITVQDIEEIADDDQILLYIEAELEISQDNKYQYINMLDWYYDDDYDIGRADREITNAVINDINSPSSSIINGIKRCERFNKLNLFRLEPSMDMKLFACGHEVNEHRDIMSESKKLHAKKRIKAINESMCLPHCAEQIWWDGEDSLFIKGTDGYYYSCYPTYGDAYQLDTPLMKKLGDTLQKEVYQKLREMAGNVYMSIGLQRDHYGIWGTGNGELGFYIDGWDLYKPEIIAAVQKIVSKYGFGEAMDCTEDQAGYVFPYEGKDPGYTEEWVNDHIKGMTDVTDQVDYLFDEPYDLKGNASQALRILKNDGKRQSYVYDDEIPDDVEL